MTEEEIKENHRGTIRKMLEIYNIRGHIYRGRYALFSTTLSAVITLICWGLAVDIYEMIQYFTSLGLGILPSLLGFSLGSYALLVGFACSDHLAKFTKPVSPDVNSGGFTLFQRASSVLGHGVVSQVIVLLTLFLIQVIMKIDETVEITSFQFPFIHGVNAFGFFLILTGNIFCMSYMIAMIRAIFGLSQAANMFSLLKNIKEQEKNNGHTP